MSKPLQRAAALTIQAASLAVALYGPAGAAATYFVSTTGSDTPTTLGTSKTTAFRTLQRAANLAKPGDTVWVLAGRYPAFSFNSVNGTSSAPIVFKAMQGERVIVDRYLGGGGGYRAIEFNGTCSYIVVDGLELTDSDPKIDANRNCDVVNNLATCSAIFKSTFAGRNGIKINSKLEQPMHHLTLQNLQIYHNAGQAILGGGHHHSILNNHIYENGVISEGYGMYITGDSHLIKGNRSHDNNGHGIRTGTDGGAKGYLTNTVIENNRTYHNVRPFIHYKNFTEPVLYSGGDGIVIWHGHGNIIRNNLSYDNSNGWGIRVNGDAPFNNLVYNNTIYRNGRQGIYVYADELNIIRNNIVFANLGKGGYSGQMFIGTGSTESNNLTSDPLFVGATEFNFQLKAGSPAIRAGLNLYSAGVKTDFTGAARPSSGAFDVGAYQFGSDALAISPRAPTEFLVQ